MLEIVSKLLLHKQLEFEKGSIKLLNQNVVILPLYNLCQLQRSLEKHGEIKELYLSSKELGKEWISSLFQTYKMTTIAEQARWGENVFTLAGHGEMKVKEWDTEKKLMIYQIFNSNIAKIYGKTQNAVDHIPRGWFAGASTVFFKTDVDAVEIKCMAKGDQYCEFLVQPKVNFDWKDKVVTEQLGFLMD